MSALVPKVETYTDPL